MPGGRFAAEDDRLELEKGKGGTRRKHVRKFGSVFWPAQNLLQCSLIHAASNGASQQQANRCRLGQCRGSHTGLARTARPTVLGGCNLGRSLPLLSDTFAVALRFHCTAGFSSLYLQVLAVVTCCCNAPE